MKKSSIQGVMSAAARRVRTAGVLMGILLLTGCKSDAVQQPRLTQGQKESYGQIIEGRYGGSYIIDWADSSMPPRLDEDGKKVREMTREKVEGAAISVTDFGLRSVIFQSFPIRLLSHVVEDDGMKEALASMPDMNLTTRYNFALDTDFESVIWWMEDMTAALPLTYGGAEHTILLTFRNQGVRWIIGNGKAEGDLSFGKIASLNFSLDKIYVDGNLFQTLDIFENSVLHAIFKLSEDED